MKAILWTFMFTFILKLQVFLRKPLYALVLSDVVLSSCTCFSNKPSVDRRDTSLCRWKCDERVPKADLKHGQTLTPNVYSALKRSDPLLLSLNSRTFHLNSTNFKSAAVKVTQYRGKDCFLEDISVSFQVFQTVSSSCDRRVDYS